MKNKKANRNPKREMALKMQTKEERLIKGMFGSPYLSKAYEARRQAIKDRVKKQGQGIIKKISTWVSKRSLKKHEKSNLETPVSA